ncbi:MAG: PASTA domain-containing protein, partial [Candidatus Thorarchaeota archaeon]
MAENLRSRIKELEKDVKLRDNIVAGLQAEKLESDSRSAVLEKRVRELEAENLELSKNVSKLQMERPKIPSARLISSFRDALDDMQVSLESRKGRTKYLVSDIDISLKANVSYEDDQIHFQLPKLDDTISPDTLSTVNFRIKSMPEMREDIFGYEEVMDLIGMNIEKGEDLIIEKGFKVGEIEYRYTEQIEPDTIVGQMPSPFALAPPGSLIDLVVSKRAMVKVPNFLGLSLDEAKRIFESAELTVGDVSESASESPEGTVISQSIMAGEEVRHGTSIDLVIAEKRKAKEEE